MKSWSGTNEMRVRKNQVPHVHTYFINPPLDPYVLYGTYIVGVYGLLVVSKEPLTRYVSL